MREQEHQSPEDRGVQAPTLDFAKNNDLGQVPVVVSAGHYIYISAGQYLYSQNGFMMVITNNDNNCYGANYAKCKKVQQKIFNNNHYSQTICFTVRI